MILNQLIGKENKKSYKGGIEFVSTTIITGWLYNSKSSFSEIRLILGPYLIASAKINIHRQDVCAALNKEGNFGFSFELKDIDNDYYKYTELYTPKLIAINSDLSCKIEVQSINKKRNLNGLIDIIFKEKLVGYDGHLDGYSLSNDNEIIGWAGDRINQNLISIWMLSEDRNLKMEIKCNQYRGERDSIGMINECGFLVKTQELDKTWINQNVNFFFDEKGLFPLPGNKEISIYNSRKYENNINSLQVSNDEKDIDYLIKAGSSSEELRYKWLSLNQKKIFLDLIDEKLFDKKSESNRLKLIINKLKLFKFNNRNI